jgi:tRNA G18 (ribose-2'-O)-methylase SpoU
MLQAADTMRAQHIERADDPRVDDYRAVRDPEWLKRRGLFVVESRQAIEFLLARADLAVDSLLLTPSAWRQLQPSLESRPPIPVLVASPGLMREIGGYRFHQGALALARRPLDGQPEALIAPPGRARLVVLEEVSNPDNVGAVFRNALAFGARGVLLSAGCAHPLYRKAIRASTGAALRLPYAFAADFGAALESLHKAEWLCAALSPDPRATPIDRIAGELAARPRVALLLGHEFAGLSAAALSACELHVRIPMVAGIDSLNLAAASAIALHRLAGL